MKLITESMGDPPVQGFVSILEFRGNEPNMLSRERWIEAILDFVKADRSEVSDELFDNSGLARSENEDLWPDPSRPESDESRIRASGVPSGEFPPRGGVRGGVMEAVESSDSRRPDSRG